MRAVSIHKESRGKLVRYMVRAGLSQKADRLATCKTYKEAVAYRDGVYKTDQMWRLFLYTPKENVHD